VNGFGLVWELLGEGVGRIGHECLPAIGFARWPSLMRLAHPPALRCIKDGEERRVLFLLADTMRCHDA
jgi:hypothetical protein